MNGKISRLKSLAVICALLLAVLWLIAECWTGVFGIMGFNRSSDAPIPLAAPFRRENISALGYSGYNDGFFGFDMYRNAGNNVELRVQSYPDCAIGGTRITGIYLYEGATGNILGIGIGTGMADACKLLEDNGYKITSFGGGKITAKRGKITLKLSLNEEDAVTAVSAEISPTNILGIQY